MAGFYLTDAASDTAGDVGAVHHDISPEACGISRSGLWFFLWEKFAVRAPPRMAPCGTGRKALSAIALAVPAP